MPHRPVRARNRRKRNSATQSVSQSTAQTQRPAKPILECIDALQALVEDHVQWESDHEHRLLYKLQSMLQTLQDLQKQTQLNVIPTRTNDSFEQLLKWLSQNGVQLDKSCFRIAFTSEQHNNDATLFATHAIEKEHLIMSIPSSVMLTAQESPVKQLYSVMPALETMPSLMLALHVLVEASNAHSFFKPYIDTLPNTFNTPFANFTAEYLLSLQPSVACTAAINSLRAQVRNYSYIYRIVAHECKAQQIVCHQLLTFSNFVWALSVVMTRQNALPSSNPPTLALVPLWDLCNHEHGYLSTQVVVQQSVTLECRAMRAYQQHEPISIFYGARPNVRLLLYSGFVEAHNPFDTIGILLYMKRHDALARVKARLLCKLNVDVQENKVTENEQQNTTCVCNVAVGRGVVGEAMAVARVIVMDKRALADLLTRGACLPERAAVNDWVEKEARLLVLESVKCKLQLYNDVGKWEKGTRPKCKRLDDLAKQLVMSEKQLLEKNVHILQVAQEEYEEGVCELNGIGE